MTDWNAVSAFMANVVVWPGSPSDPGYINLHYSMDPKDPTVNGGKKIVTGWPTKSVDELVSKAGWALTTTFIKDLWFCTSQQSMAGKNKRGNPKAVRLASNATAVKAIWIDVDVGPSEPGKKPKYATLDEAVKAILLFVTTVKLPMPSAMVYSGGGVHVYWISKTPMTPQEWQPYASGLKSLLLANNVLCDTGLTTDVARILRVPGTKNFKYDPPADVTLAPMPLIQYDFPSKLSFLHQFAGPVVNIKQATPVSLFVEGVTRESFGAINPLFASLKGEPDLNAGIGHEERLLEPFPIFKQCGFLRDALTTGGKDYDQTLWMYSVLCSTFMEDGNDIAHKISSGYLTYSKDDTQALYDRKVAERADRGIGYPSCAAIAGAGCEACKTCPLFSKGKSPLNIRPPVTATVNPAMGQSAAAAACGLPATFELNNDGVICKVLEETNSEGETSTVVVPLFQAVLTDFWLQKHPGEKINFTCTVDKGFTEQVSVDLGEIHTQGFLNYLGKRRVLVSTTVTLKIMQEFFLSIIGKLRAMAAAQQSVPFGWYEENGVRKGFAFGGKLMLDDGSSRSCGSADENVARKYRPTGTMENWMKAAETLTNRKRPELTAIMLLSFASPLLELNGKNSIMLAAYGGTEHSGAGKSSAYRIGMSVWGHPVLTKGTESQTVNNITNFMKTVRNLPFYWDEITDDDARERVRKVMHEADGGKEKGRMLDGQRSQAEGTWKMMIQYASNGSYLEFMRKYNRNTVASVVRVLEWEVKRVDGGPGHLLDADAEALLDLTERNYGWMGMEYAKFLAMNHVAIKEELRLKCNEVQRIVNAGNTERYWVTAVAIMTLAAKYAKKMGMDVDPDAIEQFMYRVYNDNLQQRVDFIDGGSVENAETTLTRYLKERDAQGRGVWTNYMHNTQGKPPKPVLTLNGAAMGRTNYQGGTEFRFAIENRQLIIAAKDFEGWLTTHKIAFAQTFSALKIVYNQTKGRLQMLSGLLQNSGREDCIILHVVPGTPLWDYMMTFVAPDVKAAMELQPELPTEETGIVTDTVTGLATPESVTAFVQGATGAA